MRTFPWSPVDLTNPKYQPVAGFIKLRYIETWGEQHHVNSWMWRWSVTISWYHINVPICIRSSTWKCTQAPVPFTSNQEHNHYHVLSKKSKNKASTVQWELGDVNIMRDQQYFHMGLEWTENKIVSDSLTKIDRSGCALCALLVVRSSS